MAFNANVRSASTSSGSESIGRATAETADQPRRTARPFAASRTTNATRHAPNSPTRRSVSCGKRFPATGRTYAIRSPTISASYRPRIFGLWRERGIPEFGLLPITESSLYGPARNPWNPDHSPGGSSGGAAVAVAARMVPIAHANDGGGSIRIPAACCGLVGLKPTRARTPLGPQFGDIMSGLVVEHVITRSVRDSAVMLDVAAGPDIGDPYYAPPQPGRYLDAIAVPPPRIAFSVLDPFGKEIDPECRAAVTTAANLCANLGHDVEEGHPPVEVGQLASDFDLGLRPGVARALRFPNSRRHFLTNRRFHRHISFETVLGLAAHYRPARRGAANRGDRRAQVGLQS